MAVSDNKLIKAARRFSTTIGSGGVSSDSATTVPLETIPAVFSNGDAIEFIVDRVSTTGSLTTNKEETIVGEVSGTNVINCARGVEGTAQAHSAGAVVEIKMTADMWNRMIAWGQVEHNQDGTHSTVTATSVKTETALTGKQISTPSSPASGYNKLYFKSDNKLYTLTSGGVESVAGSGAATEVFIIPGTFPSAATTNLSKTWFAPAACTISKVDLYVDTAGSGTGSTVVDINKNGTTICASTKLTLTTTETSDLDVTPSVTALAKGDAVTIDVDSVTATSAPSNGYVLIHYTRD